MGDVLETIINDLGSYGIYSILDCHQDLFSPYFCGEGAPNFAVESSPYSPKFPQPVESQPFPVDPVTGYPNLTQCLNITNFAEFYFADKVGSSFQSLYTNVSGIQDSFAFFWQSVAEKFANNSNVLGYEILNEPWAGDIYTDPLLIAEAGLTDRMYLFPMYEKVAEAIRKVDENHMIFFEPMVANIGESGFDEPPLGDYERSTYSYHIYCGSVTKEGIPTSELECDLEQYGLFWLQLQNLKRIGTAGFMTEFGDALQSELGDDLINFVCDMADSELQSWTYWQFKYYNDPTTAGGSAESFYFPNGTLMTEKVNVLSRTFAQSVAGTITKQSFNIDSAIYELEWIVNATISQPTVIYFNNEAYYPNGYDISLSSPSSFNVTETNTNYLELYPINQNDKNDGEIMSLILKPSEKLNTKIID